MVFADAMKNPACQVCSLRHTLPSRSSSQCNARMRADDKGVEPARYRGQVPPAVDSVGTHDADDIRELVPEDSVGESELKVNECKLDHISTSQCASCHVAAYMVGMVWLLVISWSWHRKR